MKKNLRWLCLLIAVLLVLSMVACGSADEDDTEKGGDDIGEDIGENSGYTDFDISREESDTKLSALAKDKGYVISLRYTEDDGEETVTWGSKGGLWWYLSSEDGMAVNSLGSECEMYVYDSGTWSYNGSLTGEMAENYGEVYSGLFGLWLYIGSTFEGQCECVGTEKIAGRECKKYEYDMMKENGASAVSGLTNFKYTICVDNEYGITMKYNYEATVNGESSQTGMVVTEFSIGSDVRLPDLVAPSADEKVVYGSTTWPDEYSKYIPEPGFGKITSINYGQGQLTGNFEECNTADIKAYCETLVGLGYQGDVTTMDTMVFFTGISANGSEASIVGDKETMTLIFRKAD